MISLLRKPPKLKHFLKLLGSLKLLWLQTYRYLRYALDQLHWSLIESGSPGRHAKLERFLDLLFFQSKFEQFSFRFGSVCLWTENCCLLIWKWVFFMIVRKGCFWGVCIYGQFVWIGYLILTLWAKVKSFKLAWSQLSYQLLWVFHHTTCIIFLQ